MIDLPEPGTKRWVPHRKAEIVAAVRGGLISLEEVCSRYELTVDELQSRQESFDQHGLRGLTHDVYPAVSFRTSAPSMVVVGSRAILSV